MGNYGITAAMLGKPVPYPNGSGGVGYAVPTLNGASAGPPAGYSGPATAQAPTVGSVSPTADLAKVQAKKGGISFVGPTIGLTGNGKTVLGGG